LRKNLSLFLFIFNTQVNNLTWDDAGNRNVIFIEAVLPVLLREPNVQLRALWLVKVGVVLLMLQLLLLLLVV
jgi:hypothetical protein